MNTDLKTQAVLDQFKREILPRHLEAIVKEAGRPVEVKVNWPKIIEASQWVHNVASACLFEPLINALKEVNETKFGKELLASRLIEVRIERGSSQQESSYQYADGVLTIQTELHGMSTDVCRDFISRLLESIVPPGQVLPATDEEDPAQLRQRVGALPLRELLAALVNMRTEEYKAYPTTTLALRSGTTISGVISGLSGKEPNDVVHLQHFERNSSPGFSVVLVQEIVAYTLAPLDARPGHQDSDDCLAVIHALLNGGIPVPKPATPLQVLREAKELATQLKEQGVSLKVAIADTVLQGRSLEKCGAVAHFVRTVAAALKKFIREASDRDMTYLRNSVESVLISEGIGFSVELVDRTLNIVSGDFCDAQRQIEKSLSQVLMAKNPAT